MSGHHPDPLTDMLSGPHELDGIHLDCCGPEPECYVDLETGDRLAKKPEPLIWGRA